MKSTLNRYPRYAKASDGNLHPCKFKMCNRKISQSVPQEPPREERSRRGSSKQTERSLFFRIRFGLEDLIEIIIRKIIVFAIRLIFQEIDEFLFDQWLKSSVDDCVPVEISAVLARWKRKAESEPHATN